MKPDFYNINPDVAPEETKESLEERFFKERLEWNDKISEMSAKIHRIMDIPELMTYLYTERQRAVEYYHYIISLLININKKYRAQYDERLMFYTYKSQVKYPNETLKANRIKVDLADLLVKREMLENHSHFLQEVKGSLDHIIWAIPRRVEIEKMSRGSD